MPEFLEVLFGESVTVKVVYYGILTAIGLLIFFLIYSKFAPGPRRRRSLKQVRQLLAQGKWADAAKALEKTRQVGMPSAGWQRTFDQVDAEILQRAQDSALQERRFDRALDVANRLAEIRGLSPMEARLNIQAAMLNELRRLFAIPGESRAVLELAGQTLQIHSPCREASFWQAMAYLRGGQPEKALETFQIARGGGEGRAPELDDELMPRPAAAPSAPATPFIDPSLYLGAVLLRQGKAKESLRYLTEANRMDPNCPVVTILLGSAIVEAGGDTKFAVKALQRALGPKGLQIWANHPQRAWVEGFPDGRSYVRRLASTFTFQCPVFGEDLKFLLLQGMLSLGQGLYKLGDYQEAANYFTKVIQEGAPSLPVVRGVGLSLARIGRYDEAFRHLRAALEMENPPERTTAGFLALCGAKGTPKSEEDRRRNLAWAIQTVMPFTAPGDVEWVALINAIFAEAREAELPISEDDQLYLCEHLVSVDAADPVAAQAYHHLHKTYPRAVRPEYAFLYCRAAQQHRVAEEQSLDLFALAFADRGALEAFYAAKGWDVGEVELTYLAQAAERQPGHFPDALGADYPPRGEELLRAKSAALEKASDLDASLRVADILGRLAPGSALAQDRVASLFFRRGNIEQALDVLDRWQSAHPADPLPLARAALVRYGQGDMDRALELLAQARDKASGTMRGNILYLIGQLALRRLAAEHPEGLPVDALQTAQQHLEACLQDSPGHVSALWNLAAIRWLRGDEGGLAQLAAALDREDATGPEALYFGALARFFEGDFNRAVSLCERLRQEHPSIPLVTPEGSVAESLRESRPLAASAAAESAHAASGHHSPERNGEAEATYLDWAVEAAYLQGLAEQARGELGHAAEAFDVAARAGDSPSAGHAQALLGKVSFDAGDYETAGHCWQNLDQKRRSAWRIGEALGGTVFLTALEAMEEGRFVEAADKLRSAGKLGCRDRRLGQLLTLSLFRAGQKMVYGNVTR